MQLENLILRLKQQKHKNSYPKNDKKMIEAIERFKKCNNKKIESIIKKEINICKKYWGCYPLHYYRYNLYQKDKQLTEKELINYIPEFYFYRLFLNYYDDDKYSILLGDKNLTEMLFRSVGIKQPITVGKCINGILYDVWLNEISFDDMYQQIINDNKVKKIFMKPCDGQGGFGIEIFNKKNNNFNNNNNEILDNTFIKKLSKKNNYIIQLGLNQDEEISKIYPNSINTFRIATENKNGICRVVCLTLRIGKDGNEVDNSAQDGIVLGINEATGECNNFAITEKGKIYIKHPNTQFEFKNKIIPKWNLIKNFTLECSKKLPQFTYLGWDIALTKEGPVAIETNLGFGIDHFQVALGGVREKFQIKDPNKYWRKCHEK